MKRLGAVLLAAALAAGCSHKSGVVSPAEEAQKMKAAAAFQAVQDAQDKLGSGLLAHFPKSLGKAKCDIPEGGVGTKTIAGTCETKVQADGRDWVVSFIQTWDAKDFHESHSPASGQLTHTWQFRVDTNGTVHDATLAGDFPPQLVK